MAAPVCVMGRLRLDDPKSADLLADSKDQPGMLGIRHTFNRTQTGWLTDGTADRLWPAAAKAGTPVMTPTAGRAATFCASSSAIRTRLHHRPHEPVGRRRQGG